jgi:hypothetical protein
LVLLEKRSALAADLAVAEDAVTCLRRQIMALSETLKTFGHLEPEHDRMARTNELREIDA